MTHPQIDLIKAHANCQAGMYLNGTYRNPDWFGGFSEVVSDFFWNFVSPLRLPGETTDSGVYDFYQKLDRTPALYGESAFINEVVDYLSLAELEVGYQDLWMEYTQGEVSPGSTELAIRDIRGQAAPDAFLDIFKSAYGDSDSDDPYAGLPPTYIQALQDGFDSEYLGTDDTHLVAYDGETPVSIGSIIRHNDVAIIYNMGTQPDRQGEGIGTRIAEHLIADMLDAGVERILLQTEPGSYVADFYEDLGFEAIFEATGYIGGDWESRFSTTS